MTVDSWPRNIVCDMPFDRLFYGSGVQFDALKMDLIEVQIGTRPHVFARSDTPEGVDGDLPFT
jgi:hypothetical protein